MSTDNSPLHPNFFKTPKPKNQTVKKNIQTSHLLKEKKSPGGSLSEVRVFDKSSGPNLKFEKKEKIIFTPFIKTSTKNTEESLKSHNTNQKENIKKNKKTNLNSPIPTKKQKLSTKIHNSAEKLPFILSYYPKSSIFLQGFSEISLNFPKEITCDNNYNSFLTAIKEYFDKLQIEINKEKDKICDSMERLIKDKEMFDRKNVISDVDYLKEIKKVCDSYMVKIEEDLCLTNDNEVNDMNEIRVLEKIQEIMTINVKRNDEIIEYDRNNKTLNNNNKTKVYSHALNKSYDRIITKLEIEYGNLKKSTIELEYKLHQILKDATCITDEIKKKKKENMLETILGVNPLSSAESEQSGQYTISNINIGRNLDNYMNK